MFGAVTDRTCVVIPSKPHPDLTPHQVIQAQLEALRRNDDPHPDAGIATAFGFASRANRQATGPVARFARLLKNPHYRPMLGHSAAQLGPTQVDGDIARVQVVLLGGDGRMMAYDFTLSRDEPTRCWLTDSVMVAPVEVA